LPRQSKGLEKQRGLAIPHILSNHTATILIWMGYPGEFQNTRRGGIGCDLRHLVGF
jgi:hypothetical protein